MENDIIFSPFQIKNFTLHNRLGVAPMTRISSPGDSIPRQDVLDFLVRRACSQYEGHRAPEMNSPAGRGRHWLPRPPSGRVADRWNGLNEQYPDRRANVRQCIYQDLGDTRSRGLLVQRVSSLQECAPVRPQRKNRAILRYYSTHGNCCWAPRGAAPAKIMRLQGKTRLGEFAYPSGIYQNAID